MKLEEVNTRTKEAVDFLVAALESGHSEVLTAYLGAMAKFHTYSFGNIMLIARQKPDATNVAGLRTWNSLGRFVKRGEKGIFILAPMVGRRSTLAAAGSGGIEDWSLTSMQQRLLKTGGRLVKHARYCWLMLAEGHLTRADRKSTRLNSSHLGISYAVFCL